MLSSVAASSASSGSGTSTDIRAPLWDHVHITERAKVGGNTKWRCRYCNYNGFSSYTHVEAHQLQIKNKGFSSYTGLLVALCNSGIFMFFLKKYWNVSTYHVFFLKCCISISVSAGYRYTYLYPCRIEHKTVQFGRNCRTA
jgi:hypothetical protein